MVDGVTAKCMCLMNGEAGLEEFPVSIFCQLLTFCTVINVLVIPEQRMKGDLQFTSFCSFKPRCLFIDVIKHRCF